MEVVKKPWGSYEDYYRDDLCVFKKIIVSPGQALSYQYHDNRHEVWFVAKGIATVRTSTLCPGSRAKCGATF